MLQAGVITRIWVIRRFYSDGENLICQRVSYHALRQTDDFGSFPPPCSTLSLNISVQVSTNTFISLAVLQTPVPIQHISIPLKASPSATTRAARPASFAQDLGAPTFDIK
jgi:hypothetical protein